MRKLQTRASGALQALGDDQNAMQIRSTVAEKKAELLTKRRQYEEEWRGMEGHEVAMKKIGDQIEALMSEIESLLGGDMAPSSVTTPASDDGTFYDADDESPPRLIIDHPNPLGCHPVQSQGTPRLRRVTRSLWS